MAVVSFIISLIAIGLSLFALSRVGGLKELKKKSADALEKVQKGLWTEEEKKESKK